MDERTKGGRLRERLMRLPTEKPNIEQGTGKDKPSIRLILESHKHTPLGFKAVVSASLDGVEIHSDEVNLWQARRRTAFAKDCVQAIKQDLTTTQTDQITETIEASLRTIEQGLKATANKEKSKPVSTTDNDKPKEISEKDREEALGLLKDPNLLARVQEDLTKMGIVDEERNKVLIYLIATSRGMLKGLAGTLKASSSAGKNHLLNSVVFLIPPEDVKEFTYLSAKALYYMGENGVKNKLVICTEIAGREAAEYSVRTLISEPFITCAIPVRSNDGGPFQTQEFKVNGPIAYLDTTTSFNLHPENATRLFEIYLNEEETQTKDIIQQQAREAGPEAFHIKAERERIMSVYQNAQRILRPELDVIIPFSHLIVFPSENVRARRDFQKLLNLIKVIAFLHQYQRETKHEGEKEYIVATLVDYELAYHLVKDTLVETLDDLDKRSRDVLNRVKEELNKRGGKLEFNRDDVAVWSGKKKNKLNAVFKELEKKEYFLDQHGQPIEDWSRQKRIYTLNPDLVNEKPIFTGLTTPEELRKRWEGQAEKGGQVEPEKPLQNQELPNLSHLSLLSPPLEEKK